MTKDEPSHSKYYLKPQMVILEIQTEIEIIEKNFSLYEETNFNGREEGIDYIEFHIIDRIEGLLQKINPPEELIFLKQYAEKVKCRLEKIDIYLFQQLRANIQIGVYTGATFKSLIDKYVGCNLNDRQQQDKIGYDNLDVFINKLFPIQAVPLETKDKEPEMVYYQKTPARIIFELVEKACFTEKDVFYDLGSGLGQVPILVNLLSGTIAKGVEFEPAYCNYASVCAAELNLSDVEFINTDARAANYSEGTVFFMYTPFEGSILQEVLEILQEESKRKRISLFTYGPCTTHVARQSWLNCVDQNENHTYKLCEFRSL